MRIDVITDKLNQLWHLYPDLRFAQILSILELPEELKNTESFYWEDDVWENIINNTISKIANSNN